MWYKGTLQDCQEYEEQVCSNENYSGTTTCWAVPIKKHDEDIYIVKKHDNYTDQSGNLELINEMPDDWYPPIEI